MPKYSIEVRTPLLRLWDIEASDRDEAERMAKRATLQLQYDGIIPDGCNQTNGDELDEPTIERVEVIG